jgi:hypothetical protein
MTMMSYPQWLESRICLLRVAAHERRMARRAQPPIDNAATRAKRKYEASAKGQATRQRYTNSAARLESKATYRNTTWGRSAIWRWYFKDRIAGSEARCVAFGFTREQVLNGSAVASVLAEYAAISAR